jgi:hypothetical protein
MKNINTNDLEKLSAYVDGELSAVEIDELERKIATSPDLQKKLIELKRIKELTAVSFNRIQEAPYFETRVIAALENEKSLKRILKKWSPVIGVVVVTITLMIFLKFNPKVLDELVDEQKSNLAGFYTQNLKPLLFAADLNNEDIFNFAFYKKLPLDNSNKQYLLLGSDQSGYEYFEIKTSNVSEEHNNLGKFVEALDLTEDQKRQMDSIISDYAEELQSQVLVNENNTVAINPNLWNYQKAIVADILSFAKDSNEKEFRKVIPAGYSSYYDKPSIDRMIHKVKSTKDNEYIFFTPDTIFKDTFYFNADEFKEEMEQNREEMQKGVQEALKQIKKLNIELHLDSNIVKLKKDYPGSKDFKLFIDSNLCRVQLNNIVIPPIEIPDMDSIEALIEEATKNLQSFNFPIPKFDEETFNFDFRISDSTGLHHFNIPIPNVDSILKHMPNIDSLMELNEYNWKYQQSPDSIMSKFKFFFNDSLIYNPRDFEFRMREFEEDMEKLKEDMNKLEKEIRKDSSKSKKGVEI